MNRPAEGTGGWTLHPQLAQDTHPVAHWPLCEVLLMGDAHHPWLILVPRVADAVELIDLDVERQAALLREIAHASRALRAEFRPDKLNVAALGNVVPQLHVHVVARFRNDIAWPRPVWGAATPRPYAPDALAHRIERLRAAFAG